MDFVKKFVSCFLAVSVVTHCVTFSAYSASASSTPTSSVSTSSASTSSTPTSSASTSSASSIPTSSASTSSASTSSVTLEDNGNLDSEFLPELVGEGAEFVLEVPESITYTWVRCEDNPNNGGSYRWLHKECVMNCRSITEGYSLVVYGEYENILLSPFTSSFNFDGEVLKDERVVFSSVGEQEVGCSLRVRKKWLDDFEDGETRQAGTLTYSIEFLETEKLEL